MSDTDSFIDLLLLVVVALLPALIYLAWVRRSARFQRETWGPLLGAFLYGALFATVAAGLVEVVLVALGTAASQQYPGPEFLFLNGNSTLGGFFLVLVIAPFVEEALKASGVYSYRDRFRSIADGPVFGASVGLGFGFFETFLYGFGAFLVGGLGAGLALILVRSVSSVVLHGSSTGMFGYGFARSRFQQPGPGTGSYYLLAVAMHAGFNALASLGVILVFLGVSGLASTTASLVALIAAIAFAFGAIEHVRTVIASADFPAVQLGSDRYRPKGNRRPPSPPGGP
ncbi:MAG: PrsW family intramembrane metalloprotease [Thermoplasmata archaeon]|nr:PrsW family intramembrane metalloprotease [Thermoplasmata archaeon]